MESNDADKATFKEPEYKELDDLYYVINNVLVPLEKKDNFKKQLEKFRDNITYSLEQIGNNVGLRSSIHLPKDMSDEDLAKKPEIVKQLDRIADDWSESLKKATKALTDDLPKNIKSASMEIDIRRRAVSNWSILATELESENVKRIINILRKSEESNRRQILDSNINVFKKTFKDASDYNKYLATLERSIKDLSSDDLVTIEHSIKGIFHILKIIYMISKYTEHEKYGFLMHLMATEICAKISEKIKLRDIFKPNPDHIAQSVVLIEQAVKLCETWRLSFTETKSKTKWDFDHKVIIGPPEYIHRILVRLKNGLNKIREFLKFLGPDLKRVIGGSSERIDIQREKIFKAYFYLEDFPLDIFDKQNEVSCNNAFTQFDKEMDAVEQDTIKLIHETFNHLRSAESAFDLSTNIENLINQRNIKKAMSEKYINILEQFIKEIKDYSNNFKNNKDTPPISKAKSEIAGKIAWARLLFLKMKRPISKIFRTKNTNGDKEGEGETERDKKEKELKDAFLDIARKLRAYEMNIYENWKEHARKFIDYLHNNILRKKDRTYEVNFDIGLKLIIRNTKFLDLYGFTDIPKNIINIAHQEVLLARYCNMLNLMLREYNNFLQSLSVQHEDLLKEDIQKLVNRISVGTTSHNWTSLGIEEFIRECVNEIKTLREKADLVFKSEEKIKSILKQIANANLVREFDIRKTGNKELSQFKSYYEDHRIKVINDLLNKYEEVSNIINEIEKITFESSREEANFFFAENAQGNNTTALTQKSKLRMEGERPEMASYYRYWEICIMNALTTSILKAMLTINFLLKMPRTENNQHILFMIKSKFMSSKDIVYNPNAADVDRELKKLVSNFQKSGNDFIRWLDGTCRRPNLIEANDEQLDIVGSRYSYGSEIEFNKEIKSCSSDIISIIQKINDNLRSNKEKYSKEYALDHYGHWGQNVKSKMEKELERNKSLKNFENKLDESLKNLSEFRRKFHLRRPVEGNCVINNEELVLKGSEQIRKIMNDMLNILAKQLEEEDMKKFMSKIETDKSHLNEKITDSESLKRVLDYISKISNKKLSMEVKIKDIEEKLHFLRLYKYPKVDDLTAKFAVMKREWDNLRVKAKRKDDKLITRKNKLSEETKAEALVLKSEIESLYKTYKESGPASDKVDLLNGHESLKKFNSRLDVFKAKKENIVDCQKLFNLEITTFPEINEMLETNNKIEPIYRYYKDFADFFEEQCTRTWGKVEMVQLNKKSSEFQDKMKEFNSKKMQLGIFPQFRKLDEEKEKYTELVNEIFAPLKSTVLTEKNIQDFLRKIFRSIQFNSNVTTLRDVINLNLLKDKENIQNLVNDAQMENDNRNKLSAIDAQLNTLVFLMKPQKDTYIFKDISEAVELLQTSSGDLQDLSNNKYAESIKESISLLEGEMNTIMEIIENWIEVQKRWMYLESIFIGSEDIRQKLSEEWREFEESDKKFRSIMNGVFKKPTIRVQCKPERYVELMKILAKFEKAEKALTNHLDSKKSEFSRFYFLTEADLLQILGSSDTLATLNPHMIKLYENCKELLSEKRNITGMKSQEGEILHFDKPIRIESQQQVGVWMNKVDDEMKARLRFLTKEGIQDFTKEELHKFIKSKVGQVVVNTVECWWTFSLEDVFRRVKHEGDKYAMKRELERQSSNLTALVKVVRRGDLTIQDRLKVNNLIIRVVHGREIVDKFVRDSILDAREFEWESQLKFYWDKKKDDMVIRQTNGQFYSCYEYQGLQGRLVVTPLTDRCVMTLTTALTFFLGGAPAGPAGTGKTETVKDLGKGLGIRVVVQNCTDTLDYLFMGQFFSGLSQTGFWGCFDEFNRINPEVLSVITTQIKNIQTALAAGKESWLLLTKDVKLLPTIGIYITMNPNYEGRSELPDNLKALFRPVTMVTPDQLLICENLLLSEGFHDSRKLACKIDKLYLLCKEQLSKQHHYEWGLRSIKAVLSSAGLLKRDFPDMAEDLILMKAMKDINMPKFIKDDAILFEGLIKDLFPNLDTSADGNEEFRSVVTEAMKSLKYEEIEAQITKVMQMFEVMNIRHTTMICGPPMSGKSVILEVLRKTNETMKSVNVIQYLINPKAQSIPRLYGKKNDLTGDFEIGILANIFSIANAPIPANKHELRWVILDGDVDPLWIENMNSVMDDSKQLTLENKDRILMQKYCNLLLESSNIHHATLATISRLGMIYVDSSILRFDAAFYRWLEQKPIADWDESFKENLKDVFRKIANPTVNYVLKGVRGNEEVGTPLRLVIRQFGISMTRQLCTLLDAMIPKTNPPSQIEQLFVFCLIWSVGACVVSEDREKLVKFIRDLPGVVPLSSGLYDKFWNAGMVKFEEWDNPTLNIIPEETGLGKKYNEIIIPTTDTKRYSWLLKKMIGLKKAPCLFVGESGTGKTVTIQNYLKNINKDNQNSYVILSMNFSSRTSSTDFQLSMQEVLEIRYLRTMGPPAGKQLLVYIDDLGMPRVDKYETQQPLAFLKLLIEKECYYTLDNKDLIKVQDTSYLGATLPPGAGNNQIDPRFIALFNVFNVTAEQNAVQKIYDTILTNVLAVYPPDTDMMALTEPLIKSTSELYNKIKESLPRTPIKFHYVFNIRDISKVFQGFCQLTTHKFPTRDSLVKLWRHECLRVFADKLLSPADKKVVNALLEENLKRNFADCAEVALTEPCIHADFLSVDFSEREELLNTQGVQNTTSSNDLTSFTQYYEPVVDYDTVKSFFEKAIEVYKENNQPMDLVFYEDCVDHLLRIHRIIRFDRGNALLIGVGGSGKQSLARLATFIAGYSLWSLRLTSRFDEKTFREQLVELFKQFVEIGKVTPVTFLFTDEQVLDEGFMELVNNILTTGIVPAIFEKPDKDAIIDKWKPEAGRRRLPETKDVAYSLYVNQVRENLHMIICMSPSGDKLRTRSRNFPGLISNTTIDWFFEWPKEALASVGSFLFDKYKSVLEEMKPVLIEHMVDVHLSLREFCSEALLTQKRYIYTTPKNFLDYLKNFKEIFDKYSNKATEQISRLEKGLQVLSKASDDIEILKTKVQEEEKTAAELLAVLEVLKEDLSVKTASCKESTEKAREKESFLRERAIIIEHEQKTIQENLIEIEELVKQIKKDVSEIKQGDVDLVANVKDFEGEKVILKAVYFCLKENSSKWESVEATEISLVISRTKDLFGKMSDIEATYARIQANLSQTDVAAKKVKDIKVKDGNLVFKQLQHWVVNFDKFSKKNFEKIEAQTSLNRKISEKETAQKDLEVIMAKLTILVEEQALLEAEKEEKDQKYKETAETLKIKRETLDTASELFENLKSEQSRWGVDQVTFTNSKERLIGDCLLGSAFLSYCGPFSFEFRKRMIYSRWKQDVADRQINVTDNFQVQTLLASEQLISQWNLEGLPDDELSIQNGILTENASRWPLCVDPEMQAINWIKRKKHTLKVVTFNTENYMKSIITAIKNGSSILIENVGESIDPNISPVLEKNYREKAGMLKIVLEGVEIDVDSNFRLFLTTKISNPHYTPEIMAKSVIINYSVTMDGLEEQLLNEVVRHEYPELEETRRKLVNEMNTNKITLKNCEDSLLTALNASVGTNLLENKELIETLKKTKSKAKEVSFSLEISETTKKSIYTQRDNYKPVAKRGSILYFAMTAMRMISAMYEYSLSAFMGVYRNSLVEAKSEETILANRLKNIQKKLTQLVYEYTCLSIFERHKLMFSFHMQTMIMKYEDNLNQSELLFFIRGGVAESKIKNPLDWLAEVSWQDLDSLTGLNDTFKNLRRDVTANSDEWRTWYDEEKPEDVPLPCNLDSALTGLQKLLIIRTFRKDRIYNAIKNFIKTATASDYFINAPAIDMEKIFKQSSEKTPILFILSPGVDPMSYVSGLASKKGFLEKKFRYMSLGQKQEEEAQKMIEDGVKRGLWILLQNCDLLKKWLKDLEKIIDSIHNPKADFRLWLTTSPILEFPIGILQKSFKVVTEPPDGLPLNMNRVYNTISEETFETESTHYAYKPVLYVLSFFHAVLQDRKKFGKIGWNVLYDWNESDFSISRRLVAMYLNKMEGDDAIPWASLKYLIGEAMYGGRVTDDYDRRVMMTYLNEYMGDFIFDTNQQFFFSRTNYDFTIPENLPYDEYVKTIQEMPSIYSPEVIGLHSNAEIDYFTQASKSIWSCLIVLQESSGATSSSQSEDKSQSKEGFVMSLSQSLLSKLPEKFDILQLNRKFPNKSPIDSVLFQEIERFNVLNEKMRASLSDLIKSLNGDISMNSEIEEIMNSLFNGLIPAQWKKLAPETMMNLGIWFDHFGRRFAQYENWLNTGEPKVIWLSGLHIPASYLKAIIQVTSRKKGWALDKVDTYTVVSDMTLQEEVKEKPEYGCFISGLYLEGAEWNAAENHLERQQAKKLLCNMPFIQVIPAEASKIKLRNNLKTPVYMTQGRRNIRGEGLVFEADLRTLEHPNTWILQGVALVLNTYYG